MRLPALALAVSLPALICGAIGLAHPGELTDATAMHWRDMHIALIAIFPLIGLAPWLIARRGGRVLGVIGVIGGYGFAAFYTSLDLLAGVAAGSAVASGNGDAIGALFDIARPLGAIGVGSLIVGAVAAGIAAVRVDRAWGIAGAIVTVVGAALIQPGHIYPGIGTAAMALTAGGFVLMAVAVTRTPIADPA